MPRTLGLAIGPRSIGWALVDDDRDASAPRGLIDMGVRVFPAGLYAFDTFNEKSLAEARRAARLLRRTGRRRAQRARRLRRALVGCGLWPGDPERQAAETAKDPYLLRARALREPLEPFEVGRVLLHLNQRRGFCSNRRRERGDAEVKGLLAEIRQNELEREAGGHATVGAMLAAKRAVQDPRRREAGDHVRKRRFSREQLEAEFEAVWRAQAPHHPGLLTEALRVGALGGQRRPRRPVPRRHPDRAGLGDLEAFGVHGLIFFQRKYYWPRSAVGRCALEPKRRRCPRADRQAELLRVLCELNSLRYTVPASGEEFALDQPQRTGLLGLLSRKPRVTFDEARKHLGLPASARFNLERGKRASLAGRSTEAALAKATGAGWRRRPEDEKDAIVRLLLDDDLEDEALVGRLVSGFGMTPEQAAKAAAVELPSGHGPLSRQAIDNLLPHLQRGLPYQSPSEPEHSALHAAGYLKGGASGRPALDALPPLERTPPADPVGGDPASPVLRRVLVELRKLVNAILREHGKPEVVRLALARSVKLGKQKRGELARRGREALAQHKAAAQAIGALGAPAGPEAVRRYLLWREQAGGCLYCGEPIGSEQLLGEGVVVNPILPLTRTLDDSRSNQLVCHRACVQTKAEQTPHEWLAAARPEAYAGLCERAGLLMRRGVLPYAKQRRIVREGLELERHLVRQLYDTWHTTRATVAYLRLLYQKEGAVLGYQRKFIPELRRRWGLESVLRELPDSPGWPNAAGLSDGGLNNGGLDNGGQSDGGQSDRDNDRADHRSQAIDALVIALTSRARLRRLAASVGQGGTLAPPWEGMREQVAQRLRTMHVSHRVERKARGALHEETQYGPTPNPAEWVRRKPVEDLTANEVALIRDPGIRRIVQEALRKAGLESGRGKKQDVRRMRQALGGLRMPSGVPIKRVRLLRPDASVRPLRDPASPGQAFVRPGSVHHLCLFEFDQDGKPKREVLVVSLLEAITRLRRGERMIQREHPSRPDARFVMSLASREAVLADWKGTQLLLVFKTATTVHGQIYFALANDARRSNDQTNYTARASTLVAKKVTVDPLGRIRRAND
ncbi:CRISPR-associated endonuclease Cas9 [Pirellulimonas nuda]|uniref:CRISPR-associated endonuclease Cas9 n=1 Tax=Pirellulimonas nuda TaxID=2528009 RepID=A0A518DD09_9BACT|nr:type II CRISPR RNA-guided endonuclease Cas9 [Pirellulimonas nuda]QDU89316.1 CRISPR-associated endonuclease Cas9 [Pirellulimonas nuda]